MLLLQDLDQTGMHVLSATARHAAATTQLQAGARRLLEAQDTGSNVRALDDNQNGHHCHTVSCCIHSSAARSFCIQALSAHSKKHSRCCPASGGLTNFWHSADAA